MNELRATKCRTCEKPLPEDDLGSEARMKSDVSERCSQCFEVEHRLMRYAKSVGGQNILLAALGPRAFDGQKGRVVLLCYHLEVAIVSRQPGGMRERKYRYNVTAETLRDAIGQARAASTALLRTYAEIEPDTKPHSLGSIVVTAEVIAPLDSEGRPTSTGLLNRLFEWKADFPGSIEQWIDGACRK